MKLLTNCALAIVAVAGLAGPPAFGASAANGQVVYMTFCVGCHGFPPLGGPERAAGQPGVISTAINGKVGAMQFLQGVVTPAQIADIAEYILSLASPPPPPGPPVPAFDYTDLWWNPDESGWGFNIIQHASNVIFGVIYTYDAPNRPSWFVLPGGTWTSAVTFTGNLYRVTGSPGNATFKAGEATQVGTATLLFTDSSHANLTYSVNGVQVTKSITRQPF